MATLIQLNFLTRISLLLNSISSFYLNFFLRITCLPIADAQTAKNAKEFKAKK